MGPGRRAVGGCQWKVPAGISSPPWNVPAGISSPPRAAGLTMYLTSFRDSMTCEQDASGHLRFERRSGALNGHLDSSVVRVRVVRVTEIDWARVSVSNRRDPLRSDTTFDQRAFDCSSAKFREQLVATCGRTAVCVAGNQDGTGGRQYSVRQVVQRSAALGSELR